MTTSERNIRTTYRAGLRTGNREPQAAPVRYLIVHQGDKGRHQGQGKGAEVAA